MDVWYGKMIDYSNLNIFKAFTLDYIKQDKFDAKIVKCAFIGPNWVNDYKLCKMGLGGL